MAAEPGAAVQEVGIEAVHGSLECAGHHVLVGHFMGAPISGAEAFLDERIGRRLSARQLLGQYPERVGESDLVETPDPPAGTQRGYPPGAIVVGLDLPGELTREKLTNTVSAALLKYAIRTVEERVEPGRSVVKPQLLEVSAVPIGTSGVGAMSLESCVAALVDAVTTANQQLHRHVDPATALSTWDQVRIAKLEIIEVLGDKAEQVAHAVLRSQNLAQVDPARHTRLVLGDRLLTGEGGLPASLSGPESSGDWQRVIIRNLRREQHAPGQEIVPADGATVLEFTAIGRRARADRMQVAVDTRAIGGLVDVAVRDARPNRQVGNTLYELLLPNDLKSDLARSENLQLIVDENTADLPWEALTARLGGSRPRQLALRGGLLRQFRETEARRPETRPPVGDNVLVIANPPLGTEASLAAASLEGVAVATAFGWKEDQEETDGDGNGSEGFRVSGLVWDHEQEEGEGAGLIDTLEDLGGSPGERVLDALFSRDWRIVHIAAHGRFDPDDSSSSGVIIDRNTTLTANVFRQLPAVPELVFLNCCYLGSVSGPPPNRLAASVSRELMRIGVRAVVAAGWAVIDTAALLFAQTFYEALLGGAFFGDAVNRSRRLVHEDYGDSSTWAAFQCYGDPGYRLRSSTAPPPAPPQVVSPGELVRRVQTITVLAGKIGLPDFDDVSRREGGLRDELDHLCGDLAAKGWNVPVVLYELGRAYGELGVYDRAVSCYRAAWEHGAGNTAPVKLLEQLGNFEIRLAQRRSRRARASGQPSATEDALVDQARQHLGLALRLGQTTERLALLGSFHKKAATMTDGAQRQHHLEEACRHYLKAHLRHMRTEATPRPYFALNWLQIATLAGTPVPEAKALALLALVERPPPPDGEDDEKEKAKERENDRGKFWARVTTADVSLTRSVLGGISDMGRLEAEYRRAFATRSSRRDRDSAMDHLRDVADLRPGTELAELADRLGGR